MVQYVEKRVPPPGRSGLEYNKKKKKKTKKQKKNKKKRQGLKQRIGREEQTYKQLLKESFF